MQRLLEILYYLLDVKKTTAKELAQHFEVSLRTIYRDLDRLIVAGIPIQSRQGKNGGISIDEHYVLDKYVLNDLQQEDILLALNTLSALHIDNYQNLTSQLQRHFHKNINDWIDIDFSSWHDPIHIKQQFNLLKEAILHTKYIRFQYINLQNAKSIKKVEPLQLVFKAQSWYLRAFDVNKVKERIYKLTRIKNIQILNETFHRKKVEPMQYIYNSDEKINVILLFDKDCASFIFDEFNDDEITEQEGKYLVSSQIFNTPWLISTLISFGSHLKIIEPLSLQKELLAEIHKIENIYE